jgi:hypothetical protein
VKNEKGRGGIERATGKEEGKAKGEYKGLGLGRKAAGQEGASKRAA